MKINRPKKPPDKYKTVKIPLAQILKQDIEKKPIKKREKKLKIVKKFFLNYLMLLQKQMN